MGYEVERVVGAVERLYGSGTLSQASAHALLNTGNAALEVSRGVGEVSSADELLLATLLVDDSPSIGRFVSDVRYGHNNMLEALRMVNTTAEIQVHTRAFNRGVLSAYRPLARAMELDTFNFSGSQLSNWTPLYLQSLLTLGTVATKAQIEEDRGAKVRTFTLIVTDGEDNDSGSFEVEHVRVVVADMLEFATNHIVAGMGIGERRGVSFRQVFRAMGIPERWIYTSGTDVKDLRKAFDKIIRDLQLAASGEAEFRQLRAGSPSDP
jgi:hypothetical protein